ncbi:MAG: glycosyltransferase [Dehalococcoidia bacterium]|nr:glycosyltransferase [Dehalococcoidia bacterium]
MLGQFCVSVIVPFYNAESYLKTCLDVLSKQDLKKPFEIIMVDDASTDNGRNVIKIRDFPGLKLYSLPSNFGPAAARNLGLKKAKGDFVFFLDVDDSIAENTLSTLYDIANETACDLVMCDRKFIENSQNQRENVFAYPTDRVLVNSDLMEAMRKRFHDPISDVCLFLLNGKLIRRSFLSDNNIFFEEDLRYLEDLTFTWDILACVRSANYVRKQLYHYYVYPNVNTAISEAFNRGYPVSYFKLAKSHIENCLKRRSFSAEETEKLGDQAFIYFIISALVSYSRSMILGKVELVNGVKCRRKIIDDILADPDVSKAIRNYSRSKNENSWIPRAIAWRSRRLLEFACTRRAKEVLRIRRKGVAQ